MAGPTRLELATSCVTGSCKKSILLVRLALFGVLLHGFGPNSAAIGPKLDLSFWGGIRKPADRSGLRPRSELTTDG